MRIPGPILGVIHLLPLPGSPTPSAGLGKAIERAVSDARSYAKGGVDALILENFGDSPFRKGSLPPETVAAFTLCADAVRSAVSLPLGINALRNDARTALGIAGAVGAALIRVNVHAGVVATDQGLIEGEAAETVRLRAALRYRVAIAADVHVKHGRTLHSDSIGAAARDLVGRAHADAIIVSGTGTGQATDMKDLEDVRHSIGRKPLLVGSGATADNVAELLSVADAVIVGTSLKRGGKTTNAVDPARVARFVQRSRAGA